MNWGLIVIYILVAINLLLGSYYHGKPRDGKHNFWITLISSAMWLTITWWTLGWVF